MNKPKLTNILAMFIFGSVGIFVRAVPLPTAQIALARGAVGGFVMLVFGLAAYRKIDLAAIKKNLWILVASGIAIGVNWMLLFEAYRRTSIPVATICYYFAPVLISLISPLMLREKLSAVKLVCVVAALGGLMLIVGANGSLASDDLSGILFGLGAAVLYTIIVILNKFLKDIKGVERTFMQLTVAAAALLPYVLLSGASNPAGLADLGATAITALCVLCVVHTGIAYLLYFKSIDKLPGQTVALLSFIDPVSAILLSWLLLGEAMGALQVAGGVLVLGAASASEVYVAYKAKQTKI